MEITEETFNKAATIFDAEKQLLWDWCIPEKFPKVIGAV